MSHLKLATIFAAALTLFVSAASADTLYGVDYPQSATLYNVSTGTGAISAIGAVGLDNIGDLTSDQVSNIWGIQITTNSLVNIDPLTGAGTLGPVITGTGGPAGAAPLPIVSLAYDPLTDVLYGNTSVPYGGATADELFSINQATGAATAIGNIGETEVYALGFTQNGTLYGIDGSGDLDSINTTTGAGTVIGATGLTGAYDMASDPSTGIMYVADSGTSALYTIDLSTAGVTEVGGYGSATNVVGLAFLGTPEPGTIALFGTGFAAILLFARRRRAAASR
jgi:hypothetical protein